MENHRVVGVKEFDWGWEGNVGTHPATLRIDS